MIADGRLKPLIILGCGPIGLLCAIRARQLGLDVEVYANGVPLSQGPPRIECVPSQFVALLVEFGVSPKRVGVDTLYRTRTMQWSGRTVLTMPTPDVAHIERPALDTALLQLALQAGAKFNTMQERLLHEFQQRHRENECLLLDASGRAAITATQRIGPKRPLVARLFHFPTRPRPRGQGLMIAAGPAGYVYRLANATTLTIGVVGRKDFVRGDSRQIVAKIADFAPWLVQDIAGEYLQPGASGPASVQWSEGDNDNGVRIGDASFARDALASQGLAIGLSDALKAIVQPSHSRGPPQLDEKPAISLHCRRIVEQIESSAFNSARPWLDYSEFLSNLPRLMTASDDGLASMPVSLKR